MNRISVHECYVELRLSLHASQMNMSLKTSDSDAALIGFNVLISQHGRNRSQVLHKKLVSQFVGSDVFRRSVRWLGSVWSSSACHCRTLAHIRALIRSDWATVSWTHLPVGQLRSHRRTFVGTFVGTVQMSAEWKWRARSSFPVGC